jgi:hypothetical protein
MCKPILIFFSSCSSRTWCRWSSSPDSTRSQRGQVRTYNTSSSSSSRTTKGKLHLVSSTFLGMLQPCRAFVKFPPSVCLSIPSSVWMHESAWELLNGFSWDLILGSYRHFTWRPRCISSCTSSVTCYYLLEWEMLWKYIVEKTDEHILCPRHFYSVSIMVFEVIKKELLC